MHIENLAGKKTLREPLLSGAQYLSNGFQLIQKPGIRRYVIAPVLINLLVLGASAVYALGLIDDLKQSVATSDSSILQWLAENLGWLIWPLLVVILFALLFYAFAVLANWFAAPFNGLLSEAVERHLAGDKYEAETLSFAGYLKDIPRLFGREARKLIYYLPRALLCLLLFLPWTPLALIAPVIWFLFNAWMAALQYIDYPLDNRRRPFAESLALMKANRGITMSFGSLAMLLTLIPILNILVMPAAVAGGTRLWYERLRTQS